MLYAVTNFKTKRAFLDAVKAYNAGTGPAVRVYQPGGLYPLTDGSNAVAGPHYPEPHKWYSSVTVKDGVVTRAK